MEVTCNDGSSLNRRTSKRLSVIREKRELKSSSWKSKVIPTTRSEKVILLDDAKDVSKPKVQEVAHFKEYSPEPELVDVKLGLFNQQGSIVATKINGGKNKPNFVDSPPRRKRQFKTKEDLYESGTSDEEISKTIPNDNVNIDLSNEIQTNTSNYVSGTTFESIVDNSEITEDSKVEVKENTSAEITDTSNTEETDAGSTANGRGLIETLQSKTFDATGEVIEPDADKKLIIDSSENNKADVNEPLSPCDAQSEPNAESDILIEEDQTINKEIISTSGNDEIEDIEKSDCKEFQLPKTIKCTSCGNSHKPHQFCQHPVLKVLMCKVCTKFYNSGNFKRDQFGIEEFCKWCADGGSLICCDYCEKSFCEVCIKRNLGKSFLHTLKNAGEDEMWKCFSCDQIQIEDLQEFCKNVIHALHEKKAHSVVFQKKEIHLVGPSQEQRLTRLNKVSAVLETSDKANLSKLSDVFNEIDTGIDEVQRHEDSASSASDCSMASDKHSSSTTSKRKTMKPNRLNVIISKIKKKRSLQPENPENSCDKIKKENCKTASSTCGEILVKAEPSDEDAGKESPLRVHSSNNSLTIDDVDNAEDIEMDNSLLHNSNLDSSPSSPAITSQSSKHNKIKSSGISETSTSENDSDSPPITPSKKSAVQGRKRKSSNNLKVLSESNSSSELESSSSNDSLNNKLTRLKKSRRRRRAFCESESSSSDDEAPLIVTKKSKQKLPPKKKRKVKTMSSGDSSGQEKESPSKSKRKNIRRILKDEELTEETKKARKLEEERRQRLLEKTKAVLNESLDNLETVDTDSAFYLEKNDQHNVKVHPAIVKELKPHQREGIQFLYDSCIETVKKWQDKDEGSGALLSHCMGLGKTLQVVALVHALMTHEEISMKTVLIVAPLNTVYNWQTEFEKWLPVDDRLDVMVLTDAKGSMWSRLDMISDWYELGGVLIIGYHMYRNLSSFIRVKGKRQKKIITESLINPGPDMVVCDEGHILKNNKSALSIAMNNIKTKRRIVLTGTPLQNNLMEYHVMVDFIKPNLLGTRTEFQNRFVNPIHNGQCADSTKVDVRIMKQRCHVLNKLLSGFVQRKDYSVLKPFLTPKHEYTVFIRLSAKQIKLYETFLEKNVYHELNTSRPTGCSLFSNYQTLMRIWSHPWGLKVAERRRLEKQRFDSIDEFIDDSYSDENSTSKDETSDTESEEDNIPMKKHRKTTKISDDDDDEGEDDDNDDGVVILSSSESEVEATKPTLTSKPGTSKNDSDYEQTLGRTRATRSGTVFNEDDREPEIEEIKEWYDDILNDEDENDILLSGKMVFLLEILADAEVVGDKVLIFSQSLVSLELIEKALGGGTVGGDRINWVKGCDYFRMDGSTNAQIRQRWIDTFNEPENTTARLFLISTRAGSLGANMVAANRVIIFDCSWNPSHDVQSIFRVYRFGQLKPCYVYRLIAEGTMEQKIYERQVTKLAMAGRVVDKQQIERHFTNEEIKELYTFSSKAYSEDMPSETPQLPKDPILAEVLQRQHPKWIVKYHEHDLLLEDKAEEQLTEEERSAAWANYEADKERMLNPSTNGTPVTGQAPLRPDGVHNGNLTNFIEHQRQVWIEQRMAAAMHSRGTRAPNVQLHTPMSHSVTQPRSQLIDLSRHQPAPQARTQPTVQSQNLTIDLSRPQLPLQARPGLTGPMQMHTNARPQLPGPNAPMPPISPVRSPMEEVVATPASISTDEMYRLLQMQNIARNTVRTPGHQHSSNQYGYAMHIPGPSMRAPSTSNQRPTMTNRAPPMPNVSQPSVRHHTQRRF